MEHENYSAASPWLGEEMVIFRMGAPVSGRAVALILIDGRARAKEIHVSAAFEPGFARAAAMIRAGDSLRGAFEHGKLVGAMVRFKREAGRGADVFESSRAIFGSWTEHGDPLGPARASTPNADCRGASTAWTDEILGPPAPERRATRAGDWHWVQAARIAATAAIALRADEAIEVAHPQAELGSLGAQALKAASLALSRTDPEVLEICAAMLGAQLPCLRSMPAPLRQQALELLCESLPNGALAAAKPHFA